MPKQLIYSVLGRGIFSLFSVAYLWLFGNHLGVHDFAYFAVFDSYKLFAGNVPSWGSAQALIRQANQTTDTEAYWGSIVIQSFWLLVSLLILALSTVFLSFFITVPFALSSMLVSVTLFLFGYFVYQTIKSFFLSFHDTRAVFFIEFFLLLVFMLFVFFIKIEIIKINLISSIYILAVCFICTDIFCVIIFKPFSNIGSLPNIVLINDAVKTQLKYIKHSIPNNLAANFVNIVDSIIIFYTIGPAATAGYKSLKIFISCYVVIGEAFNYTLFPLLAKYTIHTRAEAYQKLRSNYTVTLLLTLPVSLAIMIYGQAILGFLYNGKYDNITGIQPLLVCVGGWGVGLVLSRLNATYIGALGFPHVLLLTTLVTAGIGTVLLMLFTYMLGLVGVGLSLVVSIVLNFIILRHYVREIVTSNRFISVN